VTPVLTIIDAGQDPEAKALLLSGRVNVAVCPQCGWAGMLSAPLVYHDPDKELLFTLSPDNMAADAGQQRLMGDLINRVISGLPAERRKGYLFRPRSFLRLQAMIEAILEADGITPEMIQEQRTRADLLGRLVRASSEEARQIMAQENDALVDYGFFQLLGVNLELAESEGQAEAAQGLRLLRDQLLQWTSHGKEIAIREGAIKELGPEVTREELLEKLVTAALAGEQVKIETMVAVARPAIDYQFFQRLTERIEAVERSQDQDAAGKLRNLRQTVLDLVAEIDAEVQQAMSEAAALVQQISESEDPESALRSHLADVDELFLQALAVNLQAAERAGDTRQAEKLRQIADTMVEIVEQSQPPEVQLINKLLNLQYPGETKPALEENRDLVTPALLELMSRLGEELTQSGRADTARRLEQVRHQAAAMLL